MVMREEKTYKSPEELRGKIQCIAMDLDLTTSRNDGSYSERTIIALEKAASQGIAVIPATGRPMDTVPEPIRKADGIRFAVTSNGAAVYDMKEKKKLFGQVLDRTSVEAILKDTKEEFENGQVTYEVFVDGFGYGPADYVKNPFAFGLPEETANYVKSTRRPVADMPGFIAENMDRLDSFDIVLKDISRFEQTENVLKTHAGHVYITSATPYRMEISHADARKDSGLAWICGELGITPDHILAFGDGNNDADLLFFAGFGVAMGNGTLKCKAAADYVTHSCEEDGLADFLETYILQ